MILAESNTILTCLFNLVHRLISHLTDLGKIVSNPTGAPTLPSGQNYLMVGLSWDKEGDVYPVEESYQSSGDGGWDTDFYG